MSASTVWSHGLMRFHKVMHVGFGMNSVYPKLLGSNIGNLSAISWISLHHIINFADLSGAQIFHSSFSQF